MALFRETLLGVEFLHSHKWIHGDLKPENIGIRSLNPPQIVLLDLGSAIKIPSSGKIKPTPGCGGTVNYLASEREMDDYDEAVDIWSLGIVGFQLLHEHHPWRLAKNPWRRENLPTLKSNFESKYNSHIVQLKKAPADTFANLLLGMLRYPEAVSNPGRRITALEALQHPCWKGFNDDDDDGHPNKKARAN